MSHKVILSYAHGDQRDRWILLARWCLLSLVTFLCWWVVMSYWISVERFWGQGSHVRHWLTFGIPSLVAAAVCLILIVDAVRAYRRNPRAPAAVWLGIATGLTANGVMMFAIVSALLDFIAQVSDPTHPPALDWSWIRSALRLS